MFFTTVRLKSLVTGITALLIGVFTTATLSVTGYASVFYGKTGRKKPVYYVVTQERKMAISFDCAWGVDYTRKLLDIMAEEDVRCTFFAVEFWTEKYPEYVKAIADAGHEIGTHSATHPYMSKLSESAIERELETSSIAIERITGIKPKLFRPPYGDYNDRLIDTAEKAGYITIQWSIDSLDWKDLSASEIKSRVINRAENGAIVLFHNQGSHTHQALKEIITELKAKGFTLVPIGELVYTENYTVGADGGQREIPAV